MDLFFVYLILYIIVGLIYGLVFGQLYYTTTGKEPKIILVCGLILTAALVTICIYTIGSLVISLIHLGSSGIDASVTSMGIELSPSYSIRQANFHIALWLHNPSYSHAVRYDDVHALVCYGSDPNSATVVAKARLRSIDLLKRAWFFAETRVVVDLEYEVAEAIVNEKESVGEGSVGFFVMISAQVETQPLKATMQRAACRASNVQHFRAPENQRLQGREKHGLQGR